MVAFLGQVPVKVKGAVRRGDYIVASGESDGSGRAVSPKALTAGDYTRCVGVAWEDSSYPGVKLVNVAIGLPTRPLSSALREQESRIQTLEGEVASLRRSLAETQAQLTALTEQFSRIASKVAHGAGDSTELSGLSSHRLNPTDF